jgi:hypothetical protein
MVHRKRIDPREGLLMAIWTNQNPTYPFTGNMGIASNWTNITTGANGLPAPATGDTLEWNGSTTGNLFLTINSGFNGAAGYPGTVSSLSVSQQSKIVSINFRVLTQESDAAQR